jgi:hypothetical protein
MRASWKFLATCVGAAVAFVGTSSARDADVVATSSISGQRTIVASIRGDTVRCRVLYSTDAWLEWHRTDNTVRLIDRRARTEALLDSTSIKAWSNQWELGLDAQRDAAKKVADDPRLAPEARALASKHADGARAFKGLPSRSPTLKPAVASQSVPELVGLQQRLAPIRAELQANLRHADLALEMLTCVMSVTSLPADFAYPAPADKGSAALVPVSAQVQPFDTATEVSLGRMFNRSTGQPKR